MFPTELPARYQAIKGAWIPVALGADHGQPGAPALTLDPSGSPGYIVHVCLRGFSCLNRGTRVLHTTYHHISTKFKNISTTHHWFNDNYTPSDTWWITHFFPHSLFSVFPFLEFLSSFCLLSRPSLSHLPLPYNQNCYLSWAFLDGGSYDAKFSDWLYQRKE